MPLLLIIVIALAIASTIHRSKRSNEILERWAASNQLRILNNETRHFFRGPMFWRTSKNQIVFRVSVIDQYGRQRSGWVRCGGWFWGLHSDKVDVRWDA